MKVCKNFDLTNYNSYRIKATCKTAYFPETEEDIVELMRTGKKFILIGSGHNILLTKNFYEAEFIIFNGNYNKIIESNGVLEVEAGSTMLEICNKALELSLSGVEVFFDIPSSLGGAVVMNAGASGEEIKDVLLKVRYLDLNDNNVKELNIDEIGFEYRNSPFQKVNTKVVLKAWLKLRNSDPRKIKDKMEAIKLRRWEKQPREFPNAGSVFKRPKGRYVGPMLDDLNLKGYAVGGAMVSQKHSGFIVNYQNATGSDILQLISDIQTKVKQAFDVQLEVEQRLI